MSRIVIIITCLFFSGNLFAQTKKPAVPAKKTTTSAPVTLTPKTFDDSLSYAIGLSVANFYKTVGAKNINTVFLSDAVKKVFAEKNTGWSDQDIQAVFMKAEEKFAEEKNKRQIKELDSLITKRFPAAKIVKKESGLRYEILQAGTGVIPTAQDTVVAHYAGTLAADGKEFDNSYKRGEPITFPLGGVIKGWTEAMQLMPKGSKWRLFIPAQLAYGDRGAGNDIPPGAALVFDVELIDVKKAN